MTEATKENPAPLDAYETAKPGEPIWTVQGGDPLGGPLLRVWAVFARIQAHTIPEQGVEYVFKQILTAANNNPPENEDEKKELLIRALETEQISWSMDEYRKGHAVEMQKEIKRINEFDRLDIYDIRRRCASLISNFFSELNDYREELIKHNWLMAESELDNEIAGSILALRAIHKQIEIRRGK